MTPEELAELERDNEALNEEFKRKENGVPVVLLVNGNQCGEVIQKTDVAVTVCTHNRYFEMLTAELQKEGWTAVRGFRITKENGTRSYIVPVTGGVDVYSMGQRFPAVRQQKKEWK